MPTPEQSSQSNDTGPFSSSSDSITVSTGHIDRLTFSTSTASQRTVLIGYWRPGDDSSTNATECPACLKSAVVNMAVQSSFPGEPREQYLGRKCLWCGHIVEDANAES